MAFLREAVQSLGVTRLQPVVLPLRATGRGFGDHLRSPEVGDFGALLVLVRDADDLRIGEATLFNQSSVGGGLK